MNKCMNAATPVKFQTICTRKQNMLLKERDASMMIPTDDFMVA
jgi:hypothetical protein